MQPQSYFQMKNHICIILIFFIFSSCESGDRIDKKEEEKKNNCQMQDELLKTAFSLLGRKPGEVILMNDRSFTLDCIGTISAIYYGIGIDITKDFGKYEGNGVSRLYDSLSDRGLLHKNKTPEPGDIIFWDNTWDRNEDGIIGNDPLTHAGMVVKVDDDGTISYIHENYIFGIVIEVMNLLKPGIDKDETGKAINSALYASSSLYNHPAHWLSGDLWKEYGIIPEDF